jgi:hypothetical protein
MRRGSQGRRIDRAMYNPGVHPHTSPALHDAIEGADAPSAVARLEERAEMSGCATTDSSLRRFSPGRAAQRAPRAAHHVRPGRRRGAPQAHDAAVLNVSRSASAARCAAAASACRVASSATPVPDGMCRRRCAPGDCQTESTEAPRDECPWLHTEIRGWTLAEHIDDEQFARLCQRASAVLGRFVGDDGRARFAAPALIATASVS